MNKKKNILTAAIFLIAIPAVIFSGVVFFREKSYAWLSLCIAVFSCIPLFWCFERKESSAKEITVLAVMIAISVAGRFVFAWLPGFKPVTAITVIVALWLGKEAGFVVGSLSAVVSNFYFGQGPWTPFQMFAWGLIGFIAGILANPMKKNKILLCIFGALAGILFSLTMDIWSVIWFDSGFNISRYIAIITASLPSTVEYAVSNIIFLLLLSKPIGEKLERIKTKYGLFI
jgi:energy-coupling factor transport system substrate-specific component